MTKDALIAALQADPSPGDRPVLARTSDNEPYEINGVNTFRGALCIQEGDGNTDWPEDDEDDGN